MFCKMSLLGFLFFLTSVLSCSAAPTQEKDLGCTTPETVAEAALDGDWNDDRYPTGKIATYSCLPRYSSLGFISKVCTEGQWEFIGKRVQCKYLGCTAPERMAEAALDGDWNDDRYPTGKIATYSCLPGYSSLGSIRMVCIEGHWEFIGTRGQCRRIGNSCAPVVQFGGTEDIIQSYYESGSSVEYKCPNFYVLKGNNIVTCTDGVWGKAPECLEPCTAKENDMKQNNIQLRCGNDNKVYAQHGDRITFACLNGYESSPDTNMRALCDQGVLQYPKCIKKGRSQQVYGEFPALGQRHGPPIHTNHGTGKCGPAPVVQFGDTKDIKKNEYESGSSVEYICVNLYVLSGSKIVTCRNGVWGKAPECLEPCTTKETDMKQNNIQTTNNRKLYTEHGGGITFVCLNGYESSPGTNMRALCDQGVLQYPKCFKKE